MYYLVLQVLRIFITFENLSHLFYLHQLLSYLFMMAVSVIT